MTTFFPWHTTYLCLVIDARVGKCDSPFVRLICQVSKNNKLQSLLSQFVELVRLSIPKPITTENLKNAPPFRHDGDYEQYLGNQNMFCSESLQSEDSFLNLALELSVSLSSHTSGQVSTQCKPVLSNTCRHTTSSRYFMSLSRLSKSFFEASDPLFMVG